MPAEPTEIADFRTEAVAWLDANVPSDDPNNMANPLAPRSPTELASYLASAVGWQRRKAADGWGAIKWPVRFGGRGASDLEAAIFKEEEGKRTQLPSVFAVGIGMAAPTILEYGTDEQRGEYLPPMLRGEEVWCQLFSEPNAGSDLASLETRAVRCGDEFVINGQKVWSSGAHHAHRGILLARTDPDVPKHQGITYFVVDMATPGIEVRPLVQMTGSAEFNEVFFTDVRVPARNVIGEVDRGWGPVIATLTSERSIIGTRPPKIDHSDLIAAARRLGRDHDPLTRQRLAQAYIDIEILKYIGHRSRARAMSGVAPGPESSVMKLMVSKLAASLSEFGLQLHGAGGTLAADDAPGDGWWEMIFLSHWAFRIAGGTDAIQRNTIGERVLGLPAEPRVDKHMPFRTVRT